jgi:hypothetical protein
VLRQTSQYPRATLALLLDEGGSFTSFIEYISDNFSLDHVLLEEIWGEYEIDNHKGFLQG